ncbi:lanthionine synthetase C family protein [Streptomyces sp. CMB-StM0423]|uniref:lanthionine synthetase C family protein n=1 Tax=Streptomyces sp. CMB-StM0423 TaxID=2059884 RepID=UPI000C7052AC|nr:lanthionine synthetase C family protein [Streptomyces sp. CMB-StM0423]AUH42222.1 lanthionine synthetase [Streptomyces sp. CMB-StM0423]
MTPLQTRAAETARQLAQALRAPEYVTARVSPRAAPTLCYGLAGTALLHAYLAQADPGAEAAAIAHWDQAHKLAAKAPPDGIHTGPGALAASLLIGTGYLPGTPYDKTLPRATRWLSARAYALAQHHHQRSALGEGTPWAVYDAIKGLAGIGRVLLAAHLRGYGTEAEPGLRAALKALTHMILTPHGSRPGWWLPATEHPPTVHVHPSGAATTGLAHGVAGPLATLAIAHTAGHTCPGQADAIHTAATWLQNWREPAGTWPPYVSGNDLDTGSTTRHTPGRRDAWCYGAPGISSALTLAADALKESTLAHAGRRALATMGERPSTQWDTEGPALCHGTAGVLQTAAQSGSNTVARRAAEHLVATDTLKHLSEQPNNSAQGEPGFLTGAAGTALVLADYSGLIPTDCPAAWDCLMLLT